MFGFFKRLFKIFQSEANEAMDKLENPIKMTEQGIRDLKKDLDESLKSLAEIKATTIRTRRDVNNNRKMTEEWENKAILLLKKVERNEIDESDGDRLAGEALRKKEICEKRAKDTAKTLVNYEKMSKNIEMNVGKLRNQINEWDTELVSLKTRSTVSKVSLKVNKQLAGIDSSSTISNLNRMKEKIEKQEALSQSYQELADENKDVESEIDKVLGSSGNSNSLNRLKDKMKNEKLNQKTNPEKKADSLSATPVSENEALKALKEKLKKKP